MLGYLLVLVFNRLGLNFNDCLIGKKLLLRNIHVVVEVLAFSEVWLWSVSVFADLIIRMILYLLGPQTLIVWYAWVQIISLAVRVLLRCLPIVLLFFLANHLFVVFEQLMSFILVCEGLIVGRPITLIIASLLLPTLHSGLAQHLVLGNHIVLSGHHASAYHALRKICRLWNQLVLWRIINSLTSRARVGLTANIDWTICDLGHYIARLAFAWISISFGGLKLLLIVYSISVLHIADAASVVLNDLQVRMGFNVFGGLGVLVSVDDVLGRRIQSDNF